MKITQVEVYKNSHKACRTILGELRRLFLKKWSTELTRNNSTLSFGLVVWNSRVFQEGTFVLVWKINVFRLCTCICSQVYTAQLFQSPLVSVSKVACILIEYMSPISLTSFLYFVFKLSIKINTCICKSMNCDFLLLFICQNQTML